jgi:hypothetical protein
MKSPRITAGAMLLALAAAAGAGELEDSLQAKLDKPFVKNAAWITDYEQAQAKAKELKKPIFAYFTRSYQP